MNDSNLDNQPLRGIDSESDGFGRYYPMQGEPLSTGETQTQLAKRQQVRRETEKEQLSTTTQDYMSQLREEIENISSSEANNYLNRADVTAVINKYRSKQEMNNQEKRRLLTASFMLIQKTKTYSSSIPRTVFGDILFFSTIMSDSVNYNEDADTPETIQATLSNTLNLFDEQTIKLNNPNSRLNLRDETGDIIGKLRHNDTVTIDYTKEPLYKWDPRRKKLFYAIKSGTKSGYIAKDFFEAKTPDAEFVRNLVDNQRGEIDNLTDSFQIYSYILESRSDLVSQLQGTQNQEIIRVIQRIDKLTEGQFTKEELTNLKRDIDSLRS